MPPAINSPSAELFPPYSAPSAPRRSASARVRSAIEESHGTGRAVDAQTLAGADLSGRAASTDHGRKPILAADDRGVRHDAADVGDRGGDLREDRRPGGRGDRADEDLAVADVGDLLHGLDDARRPLGHTRR